MGCPTLNAYFFLAPKLANSRWVHRAIFIGMHAGNAFWTAPCSNPLFEKKRLQNIVKYDRSLTLEG